ncbi:MAG: DNA repair protein RadA [Acidiferrobacteraceae bacterium]
MATKIRTAYICNSCGGRFAQWAGRCSACGSWNTLIETSTGPAKSATSAWTDLSPVQSLSEVATAPLPRMSCGLQELDRVLGGGLVPGSTVLIGGDPGIGKSTLLIQALASLGRSVKSLYITGEESLPQIALRAGRLTLKADHLRLMAENRTEAIIATAEAERPAAIVVDSIQTVYTESLTSAPGSVAQVRESAAQLVYFTKRAGIALFLVGHVTKEGALAGPRVLEHMVDTVLYFEGDASSRFRIVRAIKNRFGPVNEIAIFVMNESGLQQVSNPSALFLSHHGDAVPGTAILVTQEGTRPFLVEVQALLDRSHGSAPRRVAVGLETTRLTLLLAVLHRHVGLAIHDQDVFVNVVGGVRVTETAADLAVLLAAVSSFKNRAIGRDIVIFGEVGLGGEVRPVPRGQERLREAAKLGFKRAIVPHANMPKKSLPITGLEVIPIKHLQEAVDVVSP